MIRYDETQLLLREIGRLIDDYYRCMDQFVKEQIRRDIQLLTRAITI
ncbi:hypothetical protein [Peribacillus acanthi]|nr:hypothetical protein [Peribacillus acanthi]